MRTIAVVLAAWMAASPLLAQQPARLGSQLAEGMQLLYVSDGRSQPPWTVDSVRVGQPLLAGADCATVSMRRGPKNSRPERLCLAADTLFRWEAGRNAWSASRPVGPDMSLTILKANGDTVRYTTGPLGEDLVSGLAIPVVSTTVTTVDATGRPRLRVRERYAVTLATSMSGTYESPDPAIPGGWVSRHTFTLRELRPPR